MVKSRDNQGDGVSGSHDKNVRAGDDGRAGSLQGFLDFVYHLE